jgi:hypothetical protein
MIRIIIKKIKDRFFKVSKKIKLIIKNDINPASHRLQRFDHWATILGFLISSYFAWKSYDLSIKQAKNEDSINTLKDIALNQKTQNERLEEIILKNEIQTDTLVEVINRLDEQNINLKAILGLNSKQVKAVIKQLSISEESNNINEEENLRKLIASKDRLIDLFPSPNYNEFNINQDNFENIRKEVRDVFKNPYIFNNQWFNNICQNIYTNAELMKYHNQRRFAGREDSAICEGKELTGLELDKCKLGTFDTEFVNFLNSIELMILEKQKEQYEKKMVFKGRRTDRVLKKMEKEIKDFKIRYKVRISNL